MNDIVVGSKIYVRDKKDGKLYPCKVLSVREDSVKIHYIGWGKSRDEWLLKGSERICDMDEQCDNEDHFADALEGREEEQDLDMTSRCASNLVESPSDASTGFIRNFWDPKS